jgi:hypothetical protein
MEAIHTLVTLSYRHDFIVIFPHRLSMREL